MRRLAFTLLLTLTCSCGGDDPPDNHPQHDAGQDAQMCLELDQSCWRNVDCCGWASDMMQSLAACIQKQAGAGASCTDTCVTTANCRTPGDVCVETTMGNLMPKVCVTP